MDQSIFSIQTDDDKYFLVLPNWKTDYIQGMLAEKKTPYELVMLQAICSVLDKNDLVLDIGANIGNHTLYLAVVSGCRVVAFEPNPILATPLQESIAINDLENRVTLIKKGVGAAEARGIFAESKPDNLGAQSLTLVSEPDPSFDKSNTLEVIPLDSMIFDQPVKAIKIDVEGMELDVLKGAKNLIEKDKPSLFIESHNTEQFILIHSFLEKWGYVYWRTFNATPTNWFIPADIAAQSDLQKHGLEQAKTFYKLWDERQHLRTSFLGLQERYRVASERLTALQNKTEPMAIKDSQDNKPDSGLCFLTQPEQALGLDFSLPEDRR